MTKTNTETYATASVWASALEKGGLAVTLITTEVAGRGKNSVSGGWLNSKHAAYGYLPNFHNFLP